MPRINQLPAASSVAQTDVLAIDTTDKTYKVPRSVLAPAPYIATIPTGQWSGSGSDRYITVTASNVTANAMLYPFYDNASAALLNGPVWVIPAAGSFTIHTSAIPSGTVTISVLLAGIVGEAQYQVLSDVYSREQVDTIVTQSTANKAYSIETVSESSVIDFDDIWQYGNGIYSIKIPANSTSKPVAGTEAEYWYVFQATFYRNYTYGIQIASRSINSTNVYMRKRTNGTNGSWSRITFNAY
jgi:hypothetical protein